MLWGKKNKIGIVTKHQFWQRCMLGWTITFIFLKLLSFVHLLSILFCGFVDPMRNFNIGSAEKEGNKIHNQISSYIQAQLGKTYFTTYFFRLRSNKIFFLNIQYWTVLPVVELTLTKFALGKRFWILLTSCSLAQDGAFSPDINNTYNNNIAFISSIHSHQI